MTTQEVANKLVDYCRTGQWEKAQDELYAASAVSIEPAGSNLPEVVEGLEAVKAKGKQWESMVDQIHNMELDDPIIAGNHFSCSMKMDITMKGMPRMQNDEICVFEVKDGKITKEQFFYPVG